MSVNEIQIDTTDGWSIGAVLRRPDADEALASPGIVSVPASRHERDAWTQVATMLADRGFTVIQIDIRGRGASSGGTTYSAMGPAARRRVSLDVAAAIDYLARLDGVDDRRLGMMVEQDTAADALDAVADDDRVAAIALFSIRHAARVAATIGRRRPAVYGLVSSEDRHGLRATVDAYLASAPGRARLDVFRGLGVGITMASVLQFENPSARQLDSRLGDWFTDILGNVRGA